MFNKKDYSKMTLEELLLEEKKVKQSDTFSAGFIGFCIGIIVYGVVKNGFGLIYIAIPLFLISAFYKNSQVQKQKLKEIKTEINNKNTK